jgi:hypothetical protein
MEVGAALVSDGEAAVSSEPGEGALDGPAVSAEARAAFDPTACKPRARR